MFVRIIFLEPTKSRAILVLMPHVPSSTCSPASSGSCLTCFAQYAFPCFKYLEPQSFPCFPCLMPYMPSCLLRFTLYVSSSFKILHMPHAVRALLSYVPRVLSALVTHVLCTVRPLGPQVPYMFLHITCLVPWVFSCCSSLFP